MTSRRFALAALASLSTSMLMLTSTSTLSVGGCTSVAEQETDDEEDVGPFDGFDRRCAVDDDCVAVYFGELCNGVCRCENTGIAADGLAAYRSFVADVDCGDRPAADCDCSYDGGPARCIEAQCEHVVE